MTRNVRKGGNLRWTQAMFDDVRWRRQKSPPDTLRAIAEDYGVTVERIRQVYWKDWRRQQHFDLSRWWFNPDYRGHGVPAMVRAALLALGTKR